MQSMVENLGVMGFDIVSQNLLHDVERSSGIGRVAHKERDDRD